MTVLDTRVRSLVQRSPRTRRYVMCRPDHFDVTYAINPWMDPRLPVDRDRAIEQWTTLQSVFESLGHHVDVLPAEPGLPDMVFAANGALVIGSRAYGARFRFPQRQPEAAAHARHLRAQSIEVVEPVEVNEGEGDFLTLGPMILAGSGFRTSIRAHVEAARVFDRPVVSLELTDPRHYHLDTALAVLDDGTGDTPPDIAYLPSAFSRHSRRTLHDLFPDALQVSPADARWLSLNAVSDGHHVVLPAQATGLLAPLERRGYRPVPVDLSELLKAGGSVKCCTLELHS